MKYKSEFQRSDVAKKIAEAINKIRLDRKINLMEVCGTHTHAIARFGIRSLLPENINLLSGPGCPVCVTPNEYIDHAIELSKLSEVIITTFGDMFRVPGSYSSLQIEKGKGADVRIVYSPAEALELARKNPEREVVFLGVGFETTAPTIAAVIMRAKNDGIKNFSVLAGFKTLPNALVALAESPELKLDGLIAPGHLSVITGTKLYDAVVEKYGIAAVVTGFEALDVLEGIRLLAQMLADNKPAVANEYSRVVKRDGNPKAMALLMEIFREVDSNWRGIGTIPESGLDFKEEYKTFDAAQKFDVNVPPPKYSKGCICGQILTGVKNPKDCPLFAKVCTPENPVGACMVSSEGTCAAWFRYRRI